MKTKIFRDPVHGYVQINENDLKFIDTLAFQRLRRIRQSGCHTVYPSANHTRFEHSIGVMHLGMRVFQTVVNKLPPDQQEIIRPLENTVRYACLLHDVGHTPLSHTGEIVFDKNNLRDELHNKIGKINLVNGAQHEYLSCLVALHIFNQELEEFGCDKELFCRMITGNLYPNTVDNKVKNGIIEILNSSIDVDKLDYFCRDSFSSGTGNTLVSIDTDRLIRAYNIVSGKLCFDSSALSVVANFVYARNTLYMWVYNHHVTVYTDHLLQKFLSTLDPPTKQKYFSIEAIRDNLVDDHDIYQLFKELKDSSPINNSLYQQLFGRAHYKAPWKNQFQLKELFSQADAQLGQFINTDPSNIESDLKEKLQLDEGNIFAVKAEYKFKSPKVYLNLSGITKDFASIFHKDIYFTLLDTVPMVYVHPEVDLETVRTAVKQLYI
ncbi:HD domain-containing protein [Phosphitispora fastidiosa]|uniref:HD domain-containing protein n=1 Tax=Phosphitispora fastidiosa TaxID=2837202 RepID=UPI001E2C332E|nr:HD domain-containing protein [Phosphitispora fastidiosa]MBU7006361.1 HD superfamily phosphohydrolase [Phosphitispora fastidiosa]